MRNIDFNHVVVPQLGVATGDLSEFYPFLNWYILKKCEWKDSRGGKVKELLNFKSSMGNPYRRLVGGFHRCENPFFLFAEAMWIFEGNCDTQFLSFFNKQMIEYSDDKKVFHAPYGFRLRHWGIHTEDKFVEENMHASQGYDQIEDAIKMLSKDPTTRRVVLSIWNPDFDLGASTKDIPCNDIIMLKIRDNKLVTTVQNRSNDLHWGLPTNVFQFSFISEMISACLGIKLGSQTHNSQSLHIYDWNKIAPKMLKYFDYDNVSSVNLLKHNELYHLGAKEFKIDFKFKHGVPVNRLREIDFYLNIIIENLTSIALQNKYDINMIKELSGFSNYLYVIFLYLKVYIEYKKDIKDKNGQDHTNEASTAMRKIEDINSTSKVDDYWDVSLLAKNFFATKIDGYKDNILGNL